MTEIRYHSLLTHPYLTFSIFRVVANMCLSQTMLVMHVVPLGKRARIQGIVGAIFWFCHLYRAFDLQCFNIKCILEDSFSMLVYLSVVFH